jgi:acetyltransferase-like isoleucine patch superfamily enzyme
MRKLETLPCRGNGNSLQKWYKYKSPLKVILNFSVIWACKYIPSLSIKNWLYRRIGIRIGKKVSVGLGVTFDIFFPELIEIGEDSILGYNVTILAHEFLVECLRKGRVVIGKRVMIGANSTVLAGVHIGDGATVSAMSLVNSDLPKNSFFGGIPAKNLRARSP